MFPQQYTFQDPLSLRVDKSLGTGFYDVVPGADGFPIISLRPLEDFPQLVRSSTGERGRLVRAITNQMANLPEFGKITITLEYAIWNEDKKELHASWKTGDWSVVGAS